MPSPRRQAMEHLEHKVAFVTGAASGIGLGIARACVDAGMKVVMADVRRKVLELAATSIAANEGVVLPLVLDVTDRRQWSACADRVRRELGGVDLLCSNAGVNFVGPTHEATYEDWDFALGVNLGVTVNAVRTFVPSMIRSGRCGHIVITASVSGLFRGAGTGVYVTTKFALVGLAESLRADLKELGIGVSVLCPGPVKSDLFESTEQVRPKQFASTGSKPLLPPVLEARAAALLAALPPGSVDEARIQAQARLLDTSLYTAPPGGGIRSV